MRVVSLIASATEIVCALGHRRSLAGRSHECDFPASVRRLPVLTAPKIDADRPSAAIDRSVQSLLRRALAVYEVRSDELLRLAPDVIVTQDHCRVCAVSLRDVERAVGRSLGARTRVVSLSPDSLADVWTDIRRVAAALGVAARGRRLVASLKARMAAVERRARRLAPRPRVVCLEWTEPLMAAGNWMPELVRLAGGREVLGRAGRHSPWLEWPALKAADPDAIIVLPCGFGLERTAREARGLARLPGWGRLKAARAGRVYIADGNQFFNRPGPRLAESVEILAEMLHPESFRFGREGRAWRRL